MALTQAEKTELINAIRAESIGTDELPVADSLTGVVSLPALRGNEAVSVPISLLSQPAVTAANAAYSAASAANAAANRANAAAESCRWIEYQDTVSGVTVESGATTVAPSATNADIVIDTTTNKLLLRVTESSVAKYYSRFPNVNSYGTPGSNGVEMFPNANYYMAES